MEYLLILFVFNSQSQILKLTSVLTNKLEFLEVSRQGVSNLKILLIEMEVRSFSGNKYIFFFCIVKPHWYLSLPRVPKIEKLKKIKIIISCSIAFIWMVTCKCLFTDLERGGRMGFWSWGESTKHNWVGRGRDENELIPPLDCASCSFLTLHTRARTPLLPPLSTPATQATTT